MESDLLIQFAVLAIVVFLIINLYLGFKSGIGVKSFSQYALGDRKFSDFAIISTIVGTTITGTAFAAEISHTYNEGMLFFIAIVGINLSIIITAYILSPQVQKFFNCYSVAEVMGNLFGPKVRFITACSSVFWCTVTITAQIVLLSKVLSFFLKIDMYLMTTLCASVAICYSCFGGIRSVTFTDIFQMIIFGVAVPALLLYCFYSLDSYKISQISNQANEISSTVSEASNSAVNNNELASEASNINQENSDTSEEQGNEGFSILSHIFLILYFTVPAFDPMTFQRILIAEDLSQSRRTLFFAGLVCLLVDIAICSIGFILYYYQPGIKADDFFMYVLQNYLTIPFKIIAFISLIAMVMSTIDSAMNSSSIMIGHDILKVLKIDFNELIASRIAVCAIGLVAMWIGFYTTDLLKLLMFGAGFYMPVVTVPLLMYVIGFKTERFVIHCSMVVGAITVVLWELYIEEITGINPVVPAMLANLLTTLILHYGGNYIGGWREDSFIHRLSNKETKIDIFQPVRYLIGGIKNSFKLKYQKQYIPTEKKEDHFFSCFSFACLLIIVGAFDLGKEIYNKYQITANVLLISTSLLGLFYLIKEKWGDLIRHKYIGIIWLYSIIFLLHNSALLMMISSGKAYIVFSLHLILSFFIMKPYRAFQIILSSLVLAMITYHLMHIGSDLVFDEMIYNELNVALNALFISFISMIIFHNYQRRIDDQNEIISKKDWEIYVAGLKIGYNREIYIEKLEEHKNEKRKNEKTIKKIKQDLDNKEGEISLLQKAYGKMQEMLSESEQSAEQYKKMLEKNKEELIKVLRKASETALEKVRINEILIEKKKELHINKEQLKKLSDDLNFFQDKYDYLLAEIERVSNSAKVMFNNITHETRIPASNVMNFTEFMLDALKTGNQEEVLSHSKEVRDNVKRLCSMWNNIVDVAAFQTKTISLDAKPCNMATLIRNHIDECKQIFNSKIKKVHFATDLDSNIWCNINENYIGHVIDNLIDNAIRYSPKGGLITITLIKDESSNRCRFRISDNGIGIDEYDLYKIFEPFEVSSKTRSKSGNRGLGLTLCKEVIENHGGTIYAESDGIRGTSFSFILDLCKTPKKRNEPIAEMLES